MNNKVNMFNMLDVETIPNVWNSPVLTYNESVFNHISLLKQWFVAYKVGLYIKVFYNMYKRVRD